MGAVLDPAIFGLERTATSQRLDLLRACESVCPMMIPLPK
jgi:L-lactate utilization protein LutB